jgi:hypothetical protein
MANQLPQGFRVLSDLGVLLCTTHHGCYTQENYKRHLLEEHRFKGEILKRCCSAIDAANLKPSRREVIQPPHGHDHVEGLRVIDGFECSGCEFASPSKNVIKEHCRRCGRIGSRDNSGSRYRAVTGLQSLWRVHPVYFRSNQNDTAENTAENTADNMTNSILDNLEERYNTAQSAYQTRYSSITTPPHISESTPWLRSTGFSKHLHGFELGVISKSYRLPKDQEDEPSLARIMAGAKALLRGLHETLKPMGDGDTPNLSVLHRRILNTFRRVETNQYPIKPLQNDTSLDQYIQTWQELLCYFYRVYVEEEHLRKDLFEPTTDQIECFGALWEYSNTNGDDVIEEEPFQELLLNWSLSFIRQSIGFRTFDSPMVSFLAAKAINPRNNTWQTANFYSRYLSHVIYDVQLLLLGDCLRARAIDPSLDMRVLLKDTCDHWLLNDCEGPMAEVLALRLLAFHVASQTTNQAQIRWHPDGITLTYRDIKLCVTQIVQWVGEEIKEARVILKDRLCFGLRDIPTYHPLHLEDYWEDPTPGHSFVDDTRNHPSLEAGRQWLWKSIRDNMALKEAFFRYDTTNQTYIVDPKAASEYERDVQHFLEHLAMAIHLGSGMPARKPEFLGESIKP